MHCSRLRVSTSRRLGPSGRVCGSFALKSGSVVTSPGFGATHALVGGIYPTSTQTFNINPAENWWVQAWVRIDSGAGAVTFNRCVGTPGVAPQGANVLNQWVLLTMVHTTSMINGNGSFMQFSITGDNINYSLNASYSGAGSAQPVYLKLRGDAYWDDIQAGYGPLPAVVPVPAAASLLGGALGVLALARRRRARSRG